MINPSFAACVRCPATAPHYVIALTVAFPSSVQDCQWLRVNAQFGKVVGRKVSDVAYISGCTEQRNPALEIGVTTFCLIQSLYVYPLVRESSGWRASLIWSARGYNVTDPRRRGNHTAAKNLCPTSAGNSTPVALARLTRFQKYR